MTNALSYSISLLGDIEGGQSITGLYWHWMIFRPATILWAENIYVPSEFATEEVRDDTFDVDVGFEKSNFTISRSASQAWKAFVKAGIIKEVPIDDGIRDALTVARYTVTNRLQQTRDDTLTKLRIPAKVNDDPKNPSKLLEVGDATFCRNHLDAIASHIVVANASNSILLASEKFDKAIQWLFAGGIDSSVSSLRIGQAVAGELPSISLPDFEFIPPVLACANCGDNGARCYNESYGPENWIAGSLTRVQQLIEIRNSDEVRSLRRLMSQIIHRMRNAEDSEIEALRKVARQEFRSASDKAITATKRFEKDFARLCDLITLYSVPLALYGILGGSSLAGAAGGISALGAKFASTAVKQLLHEKYRWVGIREKKIDADRSE